MQQSWGAAGSGGGRCWAVVAAGEGPPICAAVVGGDFLRSWLVVAVGAGGAQLLSALPGGGMPFCWLALLGGLRVSSTHGESLCWARLWVVLHACRMRIRHDQCLLGVRLTWWACHALSGLCCTSSWARLRQSHRGAQFWLLCRRALNKTGQGRCMRAQHAGQQCRTSLSAILWCIASSLMGPGFRSMSPDCFCDKCPWSGGRPRC